MNVQELKRWVSQGYQSPLIMGILNVTPDSFSDGNMFLKPDFALSRAIAMIDQGVDIIDIGAESTRPGHKKISVDEELSRLIPVLEKLQLYTDTVISVDTSKPQVIQEVLKYNIRFINDVSALENDSSIQLVAQRDVFVCLMHSENVKDTNIIPNIDDFFKRRSDRCISFGIKPENIILDPGFGFNKQVAQNLSIVKNINVFNHHGRPILLGVSRKSTIGKILRKDVHDRLFGSLALASYAILNGAHIIRTHDVAETVDTLKMLNTVREEYFEE